jgi:transcriptional regulator with XRE-family HTH domain
MSQVITPDQCRMARRELSLSQGDVAAATGLNRVYISDFENGGTNRLTTGQQKKLVEFFKGKLEEAQDNGEELDLTFGQTKDPAAANLKESPALRSTAIACLHFAISPDIPAPDVLKIIRQIEDNEARLEELLGKDAKEAGLFGMSSQWDAETEADMQEAIGLMASNFVLSSLAQGKSFVYRDTEEGEEAKTVRDVMNDTFATAFTGVIANWVNTRPANQPSQTADPESDTEAPKAEEEKSWL